MSDALSRRQALGAAALAGVAVPTLAACSSDKTPDNAGDSGNPSSEPTGPFAQTSDVPEGSGKVFTDARVVVTQPEAGTFHGFTVVCTHQGCTVSTVTDTINCPCHGSKYSIDDGSVVAGPAPAPLSKIDLTISGSDISKA